MKDYQEEWAKLCEQASKEKDPQTLMILIRRILEFLDAKRPSPIPGDLFNREVLRANK